MQWEFRERCFEWTDGPVRRASHTPHTRLMGIVNVTPDSFSDGGLHHDVQIALDAALAMAAQGASIIDVGGESTRPGSEPVSAELEMDRVIPLVEALRAKSNVAISIDTTKACVAEAALKVGADIINDISAMTMDSRMPAVAASSGCGVVLMHMRGRPKTMQRGDLSSADIVPEVIGYLHQRIEVLVASGVNRKAICVDPGIGFGKTVEQNLRLISQSARFGELGRPILLGPSRKSFIGALTDQAVADRGPGTAAACAAAIARRVHWLRVHDVAEINDVVRVVEAIDQTGRRD